MLLCLGVFPLIQNFVACDDPHRLVLLHLSVYFYVSFFNGFIFVSDCKSEGLCCHPLSFRKSTLCRILVLLLSSLFFSFIFNLASTRWRSDDAYATLCARTSCFDLLNFRTMQISSIWFSVLWSGDTQVAL